MNGAGRCPRCNTQIMHVVTNGPSNHVVSPCGCKLAALEALDGQADAEDVRHGGDLSSEIALADGGEREQLVDGTFERIEDGRGTAYTVGLIDVDADRFDSLDAVGYRGEVTIYALFTDGEVLAASHDRYRLARKVGEDWIVDAIGDVEAGLVGGDDE